MDAPRPRRSDEVVRDRRQSRSYLLHGDAGRAYGRTCRSTISPRQCARASPKWSFKPDIVQSYCWRIAGRALMGGQARQQYELAQMLTRRSSDSRGTTSSSRTLLEADVWFRWGARSASYNNTQVRARTRAGAPRPHSSTRSSKGRRLARPEFREMKAVPLAIPGKRPDPARRCRRRDSRKLALFGDQPRPWRRRRPSAWPARRSLRRPGFEERLDGLLVVDDGEGARPVRAHRQRSKPQPSNSAGKRIPRCPQKGRAPATTYRRRSP